MRRKERPIYKVGLRGWQKHEVERAALLLNGGQKACAICGLTEKLEIDHDHKTGRVRGLLCSNCNNLLGQAQDNIGRLRNAILYLARFRSGRRPNLELEDRAVADADWNHEDDMLVS